MTVNFWGSREDLYDTRVTITGSDGQVFSFTADKFSGGEATSKEVKYRPANGLKDEVSLGGPRSVGNVTVSKLHDDSFATTPGLAWLLQQAGQATMVVTRMPLDANGNAQGKGLSYNGKLLDVKPPMSDSESSTAAVVELIQSSVTVSSTG